MNKTKASAAQVGGSHYKDFAIQPGFFCQTNNIPFFESLAIKYLVRHKQKNGREDLAKAIHCIQLVMEAEYDRGSEREDDSVEEKVEDSGGVKRPPCFAGCISNHKEQCCQQKRAKSV